MDSLEQALLPRPAEAEVESSQMEDSVAPVEEVRRSLERAAFLLPLL